MTELHGKIGSPASGIRRGQLKMGSMERLRADRWIGYPRAVEALNRLEALYAWPNKQRMPNLLLVGPTNNGKSMIVEKFRRT
ncbi:TniB family NTP-binding protein, partial [Pseudomonas aeruginosa]